MQPAWRQHGRQRTASRAQACQPANVTNVLMDCHSSGLHWVSHNGDIMTEVVWFISTLLKPSACLQHTAVSLMDRIQSQLAAVILIFVLPAQNLPANLACMNCCSTMHGHHQSQSRSTMPGKEAAVS